MTSPKQDQLVRDAADLWLRLTADPHDPALQDAARQWRSQGADHERAFAAAGQVWSLAGERVAHAVPASVPEKGMRRFRRNSTRLNPRGVAAGLVAAAMAAMVVVGGPSLKLMWQSDHRTGSGEKRAVVLADGSSVVLDSSSAIAVDDDAGVRGVRLLAGRAWFDVVPDRRRPFTVSVADARVTVMGTAFDAGLTDDAIDVALARGGVRVAWSGAPPVTMVPGDRLRLARPSHEIVRSVGSIPSMGSWRRDRLLLEDVSLAEGVAQLRRYHSGAIILADPALGRRRVTGVFDVREPEQALRLMIRQHGATIRRITPWLLVIS